MPSVALQPLEGDYAICRLAARETLPAWAAGEFLGVTRTPDELSVICRSAQVPADQRHEAGWMVFKFQGPFGFAATGILASVLEPLARASIPILAQSTFDTDYLLLKRAQKDAAVAALRAAGHVVSD